MNIEPKERAYAKIDLNAIDHNVSEMKRMLPGNVLIFAVIKANGYGHGAIPIAIELEQNDDVYGYAVACASEAMQLIRAGIKKPIQLLGACFENEMAELIEAKVRICVFSLDMAKEVSHVAEKMNETALIHLKVDTGMHRIGFLPGKEALREIEEISKLPNIEIEGVFTHFARADEIDKTSADQAFKLFTSFLDELKTIGVNPKIRHCCNSASIVDSSEHHLDMVRVGITLYGLWPSDEVSHDCTIRPAMSLYSRIIYIKELDAGCEISYGGTYSTTRKSRIATIPIGYGDGYPRSLSNKGYVLIHGKRAPIVGRICMDQFMVDVTDIPEAAIHDVVTLVGTDCNEKITVEELAELSGRFNYEFVCDIGSRVNRYYYKDGNCVGQMNIESRFQK